MSRTLNCDLSESAGVACRARGEAHVLARIVRRHVVQDQRAGTVRVLDDDVMRICLHRSAVCMQHVNHVSQELRGLRGP